MSALSDLLATSLDRLRAYVGPRTIPTTPDANYWDNLERQQIPPTTITRWHLSDLEGAVLLADRGNLSIAGQLARSLDRDGMISGVLSTRTQGLVQLPMRVVGPDEDLNAQLLEDFPSVFPASELAALAKDGVKLGLGVAEFVQEQPGMPVLRRLEPEFITYNWNEDRWYYRSAGGREEIVPGNGRWVLHCPGGIVQPWTHGLWAALGRAFIAKEHAYFFRENYSSKLANAARIATSPAGSNDTVRAGWFQRVAQWGVNTVFDLPPGFDVKLLESNGKGFEVFQATITTANEEIVITIAGQKVTTDGGAGFANSAIHATIRSDLIQADANALAHTLTTQAIPVWAIERRGPASALLGTSVEWDVTPPKDLNAEATAINTAAIAATAMNALGASYGARVDFAALARRYGVPLADNPAPATTVAPPADGVAPPPQLPPADAPPPEPALADEAVATLAEKMTAHGVDRCEHGYSNRCRLCGIERVRDFEIGADGAAGWRVAWRPIPKQHAVEAA